MFYFFKMAISFIKDYGGFGFGLTNFILVCFVSFKLFSNHLKHIQASIKDNGKKLDVLDKKVDKNIEKISFLEGRLK